MGSFGLRQVADTERVLFTNPAAVFEQPGLLQDPFTKAPAIQTEAQGLPQAGAVQEEVGWHKGLRDVASSDASRAEMSVVARANEAPQEGNWEAAEY